MAERTTQEMTDSRRRINRMKKALVTIALILVAASLILNVVLLIRVIHLDQTVRALLETSGQIFLL